MVANLKSRLVSLPGLRNNRWPEGEALISGGFRWGTRLPDGRIVGAPGVRFTPLPICSECQQAIEADGEERAAAETERHA